MLKTFRKLKKEAASNQKLKHLNETELKELHSVLISMLQDFDALCKRNGLCYILTGGTALGAVRHAGFIPWDDDVDVLMPRKDYERLTACVEKELSHSYWVQGLETSESYDLNFLKFRKKGTRYVEIYDNEPETAGVCIDVFPLDETYRSPVASFLYGVADETLFLAASCVRMYQKKDRILQYISTPSLIRSIRLKAAIGSLIACRRHPRIWYERCERWSKRIEETKSEYLAVSAGRGHYFGEKYRKDTLFPAQDLLFEGIPFPVARDPHAFLKTLYGENYQQEHEEGEKEFHGLLCFSLKDN